MYILARYMLKFLMTINILKDEIFKYQKQILKPLLLGTLVLKTGGYYDTSECSC